MKQMDKEYPPKEVPTKKKLVPMEILRELEISVNIVFATGIVPSIKPVTKRMTTLTQKLVE